MTARLDLAPGIAELARRVPRSQVEVAAQEMSGWDQPVRAARTRLAKLVPTAAFEAWIADVMELWEGTDSLTGGDLAVALCAAAAAGQAERDAERVEIVWTGPPGGDVPIRQTYGVLMEVIQSACERLLLVSFAAYRMKDVTQAILEAAHRGVEVRIVVDEATDAADAFTDLSGEVALFTWPLAQRDLVGNKPASMHAKVAVADEHVAFITSANLTSAALSQNMEMGVLVRGGDIPARLQRHYDGLIAGGVLVSTRLV